MEWLTDRCIDGWFYGWIDQLINQSFDQLNDRWIDRLLDLSLDKSTDRCIVRWINISMDRFMDQLMDGWVDGGMDFDLFYERDKYQSIMSVVRGGGWKWKGGEEQLEWQVVGCQRCDRVFREAY